MKVWSPPLDGQLNPQADKPQIVAALRLHLIPGYCVPLLNPRRRAKANEPSYGTSLEYFVRLQVHFLAMENLLNQLTPP